MNELEKIMVEYNIPNAEELEEIVRAYKYGVALLGFEDYEDMKTFFYRVSKKTDKLCLNGHEEFIDWLDSVDRALHKMYNNIKELIE